MNYFLIAIVVILFIVATFMLMIFLPKPKCFYFPLDVCRELLLFNKDNYTDLIKQELKSIKEECILYEGDVIHEKMNEWPTLEMLLHTVPDLCSAKMSIIPAKFNGDQHHQHDPSCSILRCIFPLETPIKKAGIWCDGEKRLFKPYEWLIYDPSKFHYFFNEAKRGNAKLITLDILRQTVWPRQLSI